MELKDDKHKVLNSIIMDIEKQKHIIDRTFAFIQSTLISLEASEKLEKLVLSAINNFEQKTGERPEEYGLFIKEIMCGGGRMLKRFRPAPQGRAHRIRKRSNHVTVVLGTTKELPNQQVEAVTEETEAAETE